MRATFCPPKRDRSARFQNAFLGCWEAKPRFQHAVQLASRSGVRPVGVVAPNLDEAASQFLHHREQELQAREGTSLGNGENRLGSQRDSGPEIWQSACQSLRESFTKHLGRLLTRLTTQGKEQHV